MIAGLAKCYQRQTLAKLEEGAGGMIQQRSHPRLPETAQNTTKGIAYFQQQ